jgi:hypothetical protein
MTGETPRRLAVLSLLAVLLLAPAARAAGTGPVFGLRAQGNPKLGYFVYDLAAGTTKTGAIIVSNTGNRAGTVKLYAADATTGRTTGTVYLTNTPASGTGAWVQLARGSVTLAPGAHARVSFTVHVPATAKPGQFVAGIVAETRQATQAPTGKHKANVRIRIRNLTIVAVQANVPGRTVIGFKIGGVKTGGQRGFQQVLVHFANTGNHLTKPSGVVTILDSGGHNVETLPFTMDTFLAHTAIDYPMLLTKALPPGDYRAHVRLVVPGAAGVAGQTVTATPAFSVSKQDVTQVFTSAKPTQPTPGVVGDAAGSSSTPWAWIAAAAVAALLLALGVFQVIRRRGRPADSAGAVALPVAAAAAPADAAQATCEHDWEVDHDGGILGGDGVWRFPHRCRSCGEHVLAADAAAADVQAQARHTAA